MSPLRLGIAISGAGTNMLAIATQCLEGRIPAQVSLVVSDKPDATGLQRARALGLQTVAIEKIAGEPRATHDARLRAALEKHDVDCVLLAGYMRILDASFVNAYAGRLLNIHPSLLPKHKGLHTHRAVLAAGEREHGATVHYVTAELDGGPAALQGIVPVVEGDTETSLAARVQRCEHVIYPTVVDWIARGRLRCAAHGLPILDEELLTTPPVIRFDVDGHRHA